MIPLQRVFALLMAAAMVFAFLVPIAMKRHNDRIALLLVVLFFVYLAVNAWIFVRMRRSGRR